MYTSTVSATIARLAATTGSCAPEQHCLLLNQNSVYSAGSTARHQVIKASGSCYYYTTIQEEPLGPMSHKKN